MIITLDGVCCLAKSTIGAKLAQELGIDFFSTGRLVRYVAYQYTRLEAENSYEEREMIEQATTITERTEIVAINSCCELYSKDTEHALETVSKYPFVDERLQKILCAYVKNKDIVLDGRYTFNIFPFAYRKYYFNSSVEKRALAVSQIKNISFDEAVAYIHFRDSFEKNVHIPESVRIIDPFQFSSIELVRYIAEDVKGGDL